MDTMNESALFRRAMIAFGLEKPGIDFRSAVETLPGVEALRADAYKKHGEDTAPLVMEKVYEAMADDLIGFYAAEQRIPSDLGEFKAWMNAANEKTWRGQRWLLWLRDAGTMPPVKPRKKKRRGW